MDEIHEEPSVVCVEGDDEFLIVETKRIGRVVIDALRLLADLDVLLHYFPTLLGWQHVPVAALDERVDEDVLAFERARDEADVVGVLRALAHTEVGVRGCAPLH